MKRILPALLLALLGFTCHAGQAAGHSAASHASHASHASANLSGVVVGGSILAVAAGGSVVVASASAVAEGIELVLQSTIDASRATVRLSGRALGGLSLAAGTMLEVVGASTGYVLVMSGKALAFLPNEAGKALLHHARAA
ncbi:hypothetical protein [Massilia sp. MS-15]|uniref:hypothetical protein n=1 Tax=Massilia sp. MS-15 TaxID=2878200 RepID=UPI001CD2F8A2|nr:hypothetical protein [Massilia sp. MS-15]MCA1246454.1 hypothetical protein [Massilia sp. MS-15]